MSLFELFLICLAQYTIIQILSLLRSRTSSNLPLSQMLGPYAPQLGQYYLDILQYICCGIDVIQYVSVFLWC